MQGGIAEIPLLSGEVGPLPLPPSTEQSSAANFQGFLEIFPENLGVTLVKFSLFKSLLSFQWKYFRARNWKVIRHSIASQQKQWIDVFQTRQPIRSPTEQSSRQLSGIGEGFVFGEWIPVLIGDQGIALQYSSLEESIGQWRHYKH